MSQPGMITSGMPPRYNDVQRELAELRRQLAQMHGMLVQAANTASAALGQMTPNNWMVSGFGATVAGNVVLDKSITVPDGFTRLSFMAVSTAVAINSTSSVDDMYQFITVGSSSSSGLPAQALGSYLAFNTVSLADHLTGLTPGSVLPVQVKVSTVSAAWAASGSNAANLSLLTIWQR